MKSKSICKFISVAAADILVMHNFVYERNAEAMRESARLSSHKAILVVQGSGRFRFDGIGVEGAVGDLIFGFCNEVHLCEPFADCEYIYISFGGTRADTLLRRLGIHPFNRHHRGFKGVIPMWRDSISRASQFSIDLAAESALLYALSRFSADECEKGDVANRAVLYREENFTEPELSLTEVAEELGYNAKYLSHVFKEKMGVSFSEHLRTLRIKYAVTLFDHGLDSVKNVAFLSGFSDPLYFSTVFKNTVGTSPKEYMVRRT